MLRTRATARSQRLTLAAISSTIFAMAALLVAAFGLAGPPRAAYADHNSMYTICPEPISEGNTSSMGIRRSGYRVESAYFFTIHQPYSAGPEDFTEYDGVKVESGSGDKTLWVPVVTTEDSIPEHDEIFAIGFWDDDLWHPCVVTIVDDDTPAVTDVNIISRPVDQYAYRIGESIDVTVRTDAPIEVVGTPLLSLYIGDGPGDHWRGASYLTGSGGRELVFRYQVQPGDFDGDGLSVGSAGVAEDRTPAYGFAGKIQAKGTDVPINYAHPGVEGARFHMVDGRPYVQTVRVVSSPSHEWAAYRANETIKVAFTFDTEVVVDGEPSVGLYLGPDSVHPDESWREARYLSGSSTDTLVFGYTVVPGDTDPQGVMIALGTDRQGFGGTGTITARGTDIEQNPWYRGTNHQPGHKVDTAPPSISRLEITSEPARDGAYAVGETITVEVGFDERVKLRGNPYIELDVGGVARQLSVRPEQSGAYSNALYFDYVVQESDSDADGVGVGANRVNSNGGGIFDSAGNAADLSHAARSADPGHKVDGGSRR